MKKKLLFLTLALIASMSVLTSCSKDEETLADKVLTDVSGTEWLGYHKRSGAMTLRFNSDGTYDLNYDTMGGYSIGNYTQYGTSITLSETSGLCHWYNFYHVTVSKGGMTLTIPMYYYDGEYSHDAKFTLNTLKN